MDDYTNNADRDAESHSIMIGQIPVHEPQTAGCDPAIDENNNTLPGSRGNTANFDRPFGTPHVTVWNLIILITPLLFHAYDVVTDIYLIAGYFERQENVYGSLTLAIIVISAITCTWISSRMYDENSQEVQAEQEHEKQDERKNYLEKIIELKTNFVMVILFQLALPRRHLHSLYYAWKVRRYEQKGDNDGLDRYYPKMLKEQADLALLNVIECFLESAPQLILQLTILLMEDKVIITTVWFKIVGGFLTLISLGWSMRNYHRTIRLAQPDKYVISGIGSALLFVWHFGTIAARIFLIGIAASNWLTYAFLARTLIWMGWTTYLYNRDGVFVFCRNRTVSPLVPPTLPEKIRTLFFAAALAVVFVFTFVNLEEGRTRIRYTIYHVLCGLENITVFALWLKYASQCCKDIWFSESLLISSVILFMIGIAAMMTYYFFRRHTVQNRFSLSVAGHSSTSIVCQQV